MDAICAIAQVAWEPIHEAMVEMIGEDVHEAVAGDWKTRKAEQIRRQFREHPEWVLAVREGDKVIGFVTFALRPEQSIGEIHNNAVDPEHQGRGIATAMYRHALDLFKRKGMAFASVSTGLDPGHAPARAAYVRAGFDRHREDVTYYKKL